MTSGSVGPEDLLEIMEDSLRLLKSRGRDTRRWVASAEPLPSLYEQCLARSARISEREPEPVRTIHHFACSGGTLICRFLAATPNARLLSEVDPLSPLAKIHFSPTDLILHYRNTGRPVPDDAVEEVFLGALEAMHARSVRSGERLILRDHAHSRFCTGASLATRRCLRDVVASRFPVRSVVTVRHPLDSFLSLTRNGWIHFAPGTLDEYAQRYLAFLDGHSDLAVLKYEDFVADPDAVLQQLCRILGLVWLAGLEPLASAIPLTGDSGRKGDRPALRERRPVPPELEQARSASRAYGQLCERLAYDP